MTAGIGYHYKAFYIDAAYVYRNRSSNWHAYTLRPTILDRRKLKDTRNSLQNLAWLQVLTGQKSELNRWLMFRM